jgi:hypothetical protein
MATPTPTQDQKPEQKPVPGQEATKAAPKYQYKFGSAVGFLDAKDDDEAMVKIKEIYPVLNAVEVSETKTGRIVHPAGTNKPI